MFSYEKRRYMDKLKQSSQALESSSNQFQMPQLDTVIIRNLTYDVGRGRNKKLILNHVNLTVPEGSIYGLLGPSGCGKTTMLRCMVGRIRPRSGSVLIFGLSPGDGLSQVPGRNVGYMPQEISIYEDFTIEETLIYFGKINRMQQSDIKEKIEFLLKFLDLPTKKRLVTNLSGGQKRRVSLAAALVHSPPLLILDEPTVGVDPLLRQSIWQHLVTLTKSERISVIITTHYIEEARQANVVGLMRHGKILAESSPSELMRLHNCSNLEDVFLELCVSDSSRRAASLAKHHRLPSVSRIPVDSGVSAAQDDLEPSSNSLRHVGSFSKKDFNKLEADIYTRPTESQSSMRHIVRKRGLPARRAAITIETGTNKISTNGDYTNEAVEDFSSENEEDNAAVESNDGLPKQPDSHSHRRNFGVNQNQSDSMTSSLHLEDYLAIQTMKWAARRSNAINLLSLGINRESSNLRKQLSLNSRPQPNESNLLQWWNTLMAVTWKNYTRLRRNPPVLVFQFMLPAIQVILFCLCIGGEPFDVPVAVVNDEVVPKSSSQFLNGLSRKVIRQIRYDNLSSALDAVRRGAVWGVIHIPDKYSENLQSRLIMGEDVNNETISNGTIKVYPDLTNLHLALTLENTFRETFINFAKDSIEEMGYDRSLVNLPIQVGKPVYGTMNKDGYLEFMAPGVVISISYVMATGLTALAFILERRDGLLERSLVSGVQTSQILLAHAINQIVVMVIQIFLVLGCTFFVFDIPSRGPFAWVVLLILLQGCTGMGFGLLVSAMCTEENTAVMMVVGTFYTNLILAGIIWPIEAMPHWLRPISYAQPQTLPTDTLRHILSRGWGITESEVLLGFAVTIGWLVVFLMTAGFLFKYLG